MTTLPFDPVRGGNQFDTTTGTSQSKTIPLASNSVRLVNAGATNPCHVRIGPSPQTATTADTILLPGQTIVLRKGQEDDTVAYIQSGGGTTLHIQPGQGGV